MKIAIFVAGTSWGSVNPDGLKKGMGGRETAAVMLAQEWGKLGHEVTCFSPNTDPVHYDYGVGSASFIDFQVTPAVFPNFRFDVILSWEEPAVFDLPHVVDSGALRVCGMQVAHIHAPADVLGLVELWVALSPWAADFLSLQIPPGMRVAVQPNCVDLDRFEQNTRSPYETKETGIRFLYASSPDRGLHHALRTWPRILELFPGSELHVVYGARKWAEDTKWSHYSIGDIAAEVLTRLDQPGVYDHGKVGQDEVARLHLESDFLLYPCDPTQPTETGCITILEAFAAGNVVITTDADCLKSEFEANVAMEGLPFDDEAWVDRVVSTIRSPELVNDLRERGYEFAAERQWAVVASDWIAMLTALRNELRGDAGDRLAETPANV